MSVDARECQRQALSEDYYDYIGDLSQDSLFGQLLEERFCVQRINEQYVVIYLPQEGRENQLEEAPYSSVPKCYGLADVESMSDAGIDRIQTYPGLNLTGKDVILGVVDTGERVIIMSREEESNELKGSRCFSPTKNAKSKVMNFKLFTWVVSFEYPVFDGGIFFFGNRKLGTI